MPLDLITNRQPHILIIDDEENDLRVLHKVLSKNYQCNTINCVRQALSLMSKRPFEMVIINVSIPNAKGFWLLSEVKTRFPSSIVVTVSKMLDLDHPVEAMRRGAFKSIMQPFSFPELEAVVDLGLKQQSLLAASRRKVASLQEAVKEQAIQLAEMNQGISELFDAMTINNQALIEILTTALEARDNETQGHCQRVVAYSLRLGQALGLSSQELVALRHGALLHDIGKIGIPNHILHKPGPLSDEEWIEMRRHVAYGGEILKDIEFLQDALPVVLQHHEQWDGSGYPLALKGAEISLNARIFAVADAIDAITSDRPYHVGNTFEVVVQELQRCAGKHFDPDVIEVFLSIPIDEWLSLQASLRPNDSFQIGNSSHNKPLVPYRLQNQMLTI